MQVQIKVITHGLEAKIRGVKADVSAAVAKGLQEGGKELSDYIKYQLLDGQLVKARSRELQKGIYFRVVGKDKVQVYIRGPHALVGQWIDQGINHTWIIRPRNAKRLAFRIDGKYISTTQVMHPGIKAKHFMQAGAEAKKERVRELVRQSVNEALLRQHQG